MTDFTDEELALDPHFADQFEAGFRPACQLYLISPPRIGDDFVDRSVRVDYTSAPAVGQPVRVWGRAGIPDAARARAYDDDPALGLERRYQVCYQRVCPHEPASSPFSSRRSTMMACTGQDAAARRICRRCDSSGFGSYTSASSPFDASSTV